MNTRPVRPAPAADERLTLSVLVAARPLADDDQRRVRLAAREHRLPGALELQRAAVEGGDGGGQGFQVLGLGGADARLGQRRAVVGRAARRGRGGLEGARGRLDLGLQPLGALGQAVDRLVGIGGVDPGLGPEGEGGLGGADVGNGGHGPDLPFAGGFA
jgi:hypothetical protein